MFLFDLRDCWENSEYNLGVSNPLFWNFDHVNKNYSLTRQCKSFIIANGKKCTLYLGLNYTKPYSPAPIAIISWHNNTFWVASALFFIQI